MWILRERQDCASTIKMHARGIIKRQTNNKHDILNLINPYRYYRAVLKKASTKKLPNEWKELPVLFIQGLNKTVYIQSHRSITSSVEECEA